MELVADRATKAPFDPQLALHQRAKADAFDRGLLIYPGGGTADGRSGDHILLAPPYNVTDDELEMIVDLLAQTVDAVLSVMTRDPRYDILFEPVRIGPGDRAQPLLPGAALHRHRLDPAGDAGAAARDQGRGRLGGGGDRGNRNPSDRRLRAVPRRPAVGRPRHSGDGADGRRGARTWRARGDRDHAPRRLGRELGHAPGADRTVAPADHLQLTRCRRGRWTSRTSATCANGIATPRSGRRKPGSTSSTSMRRTICRSRSNSSSGARTTASTNMAAAWRTARACCAS